MSRLYVRTNILTLDQQNPSRCRITVTCLPECFNYCRGRTNNILNENNDTTSFLEHRNLLKNSQLYHNVPYYPYFSEAYTQARNRLDYKRKHICPCLHYCPTNNLYNIYLWPCGCHTPTALPSEGNHAYITASSISTTRPDYIYQSLNNSPLRFTVPKVGFIIADTILPHFKPPSKRRRRGISLTDRKHYKRGPQRS